MLLLEARILLAQGKMDDAISYYNKVIDVNPFKDKHGNMKLDKDGEPEFTAEHTVFTSEPQLWYNVGQHFGCNNLSVGGEVEISNNFGSNAGFMVRPCLGAKWDF